MKTRVIITSIVLMPLLLTLWSVAPTAVFAQPATTQVVAWGGNSKGQADVPVGLTDAIAVSAGYEHSVALRANGTVVVWGSDDYGQQQVPEGLSGVVAVSAGGNNTLALKGDGTVVA